MKFSAQQILFFSIGFIALILGIIGIFIPLLPTTPFLLLAAACFARSSKRFHDWLMSHPKLGPMIRMWRENGAIPKHAKILAICMLFLSIVSTWVWAPLVEVKIVVSFFLLGVAAFILSRPSA